MATDKLVDDDDDLAEYHYYYMQSNGKAYKSSDNNSNTKFRTIDGKKYAFDNEGKMLYGWVKESEPEMANNDTDWTDATYYLDSWEDGAMKTGWQKITVQDNKDDDEEKDFWFYFKSNGKKEYNNADNKQTVKEKKINGKKYAFDECGVMTYSWTVASKASVSSISDISSSADSWKYFNSPEDGALKTGKNIVMYVNNKTLKGGNDHNMLYNLDNWDSVKTVSGKALNPVADTTSEDDD